MLCKNLLTILFFSLKNRYDFEKYSPNYGAGNTPSRVLKDRYIYVKFNSCMVMIVVEMRDTY